jgi:IS5 family transposase
MREGRESSVMREGRGERREEREKREEREERDGERLAYRYSTILYNGGQILEKCKVYKQRRVVARGAGGYSPSRPRSRVPRALFAPFLSKELLAWFYY